MALLQAAQSKSWQRVKTIVETQGIPVDAEWIDYAVLNKALECKEKDIAKLILGKECRVNKIEYVPHDTPLHNAVKLGDAELVAKLIDKGASFATLNTAGHSPLELAFKKKRADIVDQLLKGNGDAGTPFLLKACKMGLAGMIDVLLKNGAKASDVKTKDRKTPIHLIVESFMDQREAREMVENLELGKFLKAEMDKDDLLPLIEKLVDLGVDVDAKDKNKSTALYTACSDFEDGGACAIKLLEAGADINIESYGETALFAALSTVKMNVDDLAVLYYHVLNLKALGLKVNSNLEKICKEILEMRKDWWEGTYDDLKDDALAAKEQQRQQEISKMKKTIVDVPKKLSLFDFVVCNVRGLKKYAKNEVLKTIVEGENLGNDYPAFSLLIKVQYKKALKSLENSGQGDQNGAANN